MTEMPALPLWDILCLNGISLVVLGGYLAGILDEAWNPPGPGVELPALADPYAEI